MGSGHPVLVVTGLAAEARIAAGPGCRVIAGGGDRAGLARSLQAEDDLAFDAVVSFGVAGGLSPGLPVGTVVLTSHAVSTPNSSTLPRSPPRKPGLSPGDRVPAVAGLSGEEDGLPLVARMSDRLERNGFAVRRGGIAGVDRPATTIADKHALREATGAVAVDMESHLAAAYAARRGLPFLAVRVISDGANHVVPAAAANAMRPDGSVDVAGLLAALARDPGQIPGLIATAWNAAVAFRVLRRVRRRLGSGFDLHL